MSSNNRNTINIVISGVGGQGVLTLAELLAKAALNESYNVRVGEIHGMAQRGGHVVCTVRIGPMAKGPIVDEGFADILVGFEPVETLREISRIKKDGHVLMSSHIQYPVAVSMGKAEYPSIDEITSNIEKLTSNITELDAMNLAKEAGSSRAMNMVLFGAIVATDLLPITKETAIDVVKKKFPGKFEEINVKAIELGFSKVVN
ncbi:MAG: indolepyruvate ferredoxin oxidoreductase subunit beta [Candidatus Lokiarchaeota archaeon]|nr:indolepyruvate ferredoxin oxidoreductase subunit beta [Candidatus Lokiarchaeota archaeon]